MSNRWKVEQEADWLNGTYWVAWQPDKGWRELAPKFHTHDDALFYADRMARSIQATLPRVNGRAEIQPGGPYDQPIVIEQRTNGDYRISEGELDKGLLCLGIPFVDLAPDEIEPLALTLLALARKGT